MSAVALRTVMTCLVKFVGLVITLSLGITGEGLRTPARPDRGVSDAVSIFDRGALCSLRGETLRFCEDVMHRALGFEYFIFRMKCGRAFARQ